MYGKEVIEKIDGLVKYANSHEEEHSRSNEILYDIYFTKPPNGKSDWGISEEKWRRLKELTSESPKKRWKPMFKIVGKNNDFKLGMVIHNISTKKQAQIARDKITKLLKGE